MTRGRVGYALALLGGGAFYVFFPGWLSFFIGVLLLLFPLLSLALFLPAARRLTLTLSVHPAAPARGEGVTFTARFTSTSPLPILWAGCRLEVENGLGQRQSTLRPCALSLGPRGRGRYDYPITSPHAGRLVCRTVRPRCVDALGLFSRSLGPSQAAVCYVLPRVLPITPALSSSVTPEEGGQICPGLAGDDPSETQDLRPYRPGDPMRAVHWKLSSRTEALMVRQFSKSADTAVELLVDLWADLEGRDLLLDAVASLHHVLETWAVAHRVTWLDRETGALSCRDLAGEEDWPPVLQALLSPPAPAGGALALRAVQSGRPARLICLAGRFGPAEQALLAQLSPDVVLAPQSGNPDLPKNAHPLTPDTLLQTLSNLTV